MCGREFCELLKVSMLKFETVCGRKFFELLRVLTFKFEVRTKEVFQVVESFKFPVCQKEFFANITSFKSNFKFVQKEISNV